MKTCLSIRLIGLCLFHSLPLFLQAQPDRSVLLPPSSPLRSIPPSGFLENPVNNQMENGFQNGWNSELNESEGSTQLSIESFRSSQSSEKISDILNFWFGVLPDPAYFPGDKVPIWFTETPEVDRQIRENFSEDILAALNGEYNQWRVTPKGRLALILLLDQFTRHIYRDRPQEFVGDLMARGLVLEGLQREDDESLYPIEKAFFYLPLEHAEDINLQNLAVSLYRRLLEESPMPIKPQIDAFLRFAILHQRQIARFGRFPHRNVILKRKSTPEEIIFLNQWGSPP